MLDIKRTYIDINRENTVLREWDKVYCQLLKKILENGELTENRTGTDTLSLEGESFKLNVGEEFPILETKKVAVMNSLSEIMWFYQAQSNDVRWLTERNNPVWNEWKIDEDGIYRIYESSGEFEDKVVNVFDLNGNVIINENGIMNAKSLVPGKTIKSAKYFGKEYAHTIGTAYGYIVDRFRMTDDLVNTLRTNPNSRRMVYSLWQNDYLKTAVLPSCVFCSEWKVSNGKLHTYIHQRSADVPLGLPFNITQYAIFQSIIAHTTGLKVGNMNWSIMDAHIYVNQIEGIKKQLSRYETMEKFSKFILESSDNEVFQYYNMLINEKSKLEELYFINSSNKELENDYKKIKEKLVIFELMITKQKAELILADKNSIYEFSDKYNNDKSYLVNNPTGNEDIKILGYKSAPFIKMPISV